MTRSSSFFISLVFLLALIGYGCAPRKVAVPTPSKPSKYQRIINSSRIVRMYPLGSYNKVIIPVKINGKSARMIVDTGAPNKIMSSQSGRRFKLPRKPVYQSAPRSRVFKEDAPSLAVRKPDPGAVFTIDELTVGKITFTDSNFVETKIPLLVAVEQWTNSVGIIGYNLFADGSLQANKSLLIDATSRAFMIVRAGRFDRDELSVLGFDTDYTCLEMKKGIRSDDTKYTIPIQVDNAPSIPFLLDTGSQGTFINESFYQKHFRHVTRKESQLIQSIWGQAKSYSFTAPVCLGAVLVKNVEIQVVPDRVNPNGFVLGMDVLSQVRFLVDYPASKIYLRKMTRESSLSADNLLEAVFNESK